MAINLKYKYIQGDTEVDLIQKNKENIKQLSEEAGGNFVDDTTWKDGKQDKLVGKPLQVIQGEPFTADDKTKIDTLEQTFAKKINDFSTVDSTISVVGDDGAKQGVITPPAGMAGVSIGSQAKIKIITPANPADLPQDGYQMTLNGSYLWIDKANNDVMQWQEIKDHIASGDIMVLERLADTGGFKNYQLVKWEIVPKAGGRPEIIFGSNTGSQPFDINVPIEKIMSGSFQLAPATGIGDMMNIFTVALVKISNTSFGAFIYETTEFSALINKKDENTVTVTMQFNARVFAWSITYWKED